MPRRKGIPHALRSKAWQLLSGCRDLLLQNPGDARICESERFWAPVFRSWRASQHVVIVGVALAHAPVCHVFLALFFPPSFLPSFLLLFYFLSFFRSFFLSLFFRVLVSVLRNMGNMCSLAVYSQVVLQDTQI